MNQEEKNSDNKKRYSFISIILAAILAIILILFLQKIVFDLNAYINPIIADDPYSVENKNQKGSLFDMKLFTQRSWDSDLKTDSKGIFSKEKVYYSQKQEKSYLIYKIIIYACVIIPLFLVSFILYKTQKNNATIKPILLALLGACAWMLLKLFFLTADFIGTEYKSFSSYLVLFVMAIVLGCLIYKNQIRYQEKNE